MIHIIAVDDDPNVIEAYKSIFANPSICKTSTSTRLQKLLNIGNSINKNKFILKTATSSTRAIKIISTSKHRFSVAFIDYYMPKCLHGFDTAIELKKIDPNIEIAIVAAHAELSMELQTKFFCKHPNFLFIKKPFGAVELTQLAYNMANTREIKISSYKLINTLSTNMEVL